MPYEPRPFVELPNLRAPIALIVDDPAPCINAIWYMRHQIDKAASPPHERTVPISFMESWCRWVQAAGIRGDFTILPHPAGLGRISDRLDGCDTGELHAWLALAREYVAPQFDIHPEIMTHTLAIDLETEKLLDVDEASWTEKQDEAALTKYFARAMEILGDAGLPNHGMTQPWTFKGDESMYARAALAAEKLVNGRCVTHNFIQMDEASTVVPERITHLDEAGGEAVVSIWTGTGDYIWNTQVYDNPDRTMPIPDLADRYLTQDGEGGRLAELLRGGGPMVIVTHWQSLFSNGTGRGLETFQEVAARVESRMGRRVAWRKISDIANQFLAAQTVRFAALATRHAFDITVTSPFATDILTISIPSPWPMDSDPIVTLDSVQIAQAAGVSELQAGTWVRRGSIITVSLAVERNKPRTIRVAAVQG